MKDRVVVLTIVIALLGIPASLVILLVSQPILFGAGKSESVMLSPQVLRDHVKMLSAKLPGRSDDTDKLNFTARYIKKQFNQYGPVDEHIYKVWGIPYQNVSITFGPKSRQRIVVGAHYDSFKGLPGADDNASGIAGMLELARLLNGKSLKIPVQLIAYTLEEPPYFRTQDMGSAEHVRQLKSDGTNVVAMISLEMIGYFTDTPDSQDYPVPFMSLIYPETGNYIAVVGSVSDVGLVRQVKSIMQSTASLPVYSINAPGILPGVDFSDHLNFWNADYPAIMVTDTAFYRNKAYHTENDTWDTLNYQSMAEVVKGLYAAILSLANQN